MTDAPVERYRVCYSHPDGGEATLITHPEGEFVAYSDYAALSVPAAAVVGEPVGDVAYNAGLEIRYAIAASGVDPIQHIPEVDAIIERRLAEARKAAFIEAAEIADFMDNFQSCHDDQSRGASWAFSEIAKALRAKAEETQG